MKKMLALMLAMVLMPWAGAMAQAGAYTGEAAGFGGPVTATVTLDASGALADIALEGAGETEGIGAAALPKLREAMLQGQTVKVDAVAGATVTSAAAIEAVTLALKQAGVDVDQMGEAAKSGVDEAVETEIAIVGGGASGMAAALQAAELGAKVVVVEQTGAIGGTALMGSEGFLAVGSAQQKEAGITTTAQEMYQWWMEYTHYNSYAPLVEAWLSQSADTVEWVAQYGNGATLMENTQLWHEESGQPMTYHKWNDKRAGFPAMEARLKEMGGQVILEAKVTELVQREDGTVTGVIGQKADGGTLTVNAQKVILATGGFGGNPEMIERYIGLKPGEYEIMTYGTTGEGVEMAIKAGAGTYGLNVAVYHGAMAPGGGSFQFAPILMTAAPIWVNGQGTRFTREDVVYDFALWGNAAFKNGKGYWAVVDSATAAQMENEGSPFTHSFMKTLMVGQGGLNTEKVPYTAEGDVSCPPVPGMVAQLDELAAGDSFVVKGDTLEELAQKTGMDPQVLAASVAGYNQAVADGVDPLGKDAKYLKHTIEQGPFYALRTYVLCEGSAGGITANERLEVCRDDMSPIPGLYATGGNVGMIFDGSYPTLEGANLSFALNSGRLAAKSAVASLSK